MIQYELNLLRDNPQWTVLLQAYAARQSAAEKGWLRRMQKVDGVDDQRLSQIHGKLIAFGFLDFELNDRNQGVCYQLTQLANQTLSRSEMASSSTGGLVTCQ